jgi:hypothetical protein
MTDREEELWERAQRVAADPHAEAKQEILRYIADLQDPYSTTEALLELLEQKRELRKQEVAGILLEMKMEGVVEFQSAGEGVMVYITDSGSRSVVDRE